MTASDGKISLSQAFDGVMVTPAEASVMLAALGRDLRDTHEGIYQALMDASTQVATPAASPTTSSSASSKGT
jgi:hypothetical protein